MQKIKFEFSGSSVEAVLDRLPTAEIIDNKDGVYTIEAEVYGKGIDMWLKTQGEYLKVLSPESFRVEFIKSLKRMVDTYN